MAAPVVGAARWFAGAKPDLSTATAAVRRSVASFGVTLTPGDIAIENDLSGPLVNWLPSDADHGVIQIALDGYKDADNR
jgi:hypothetical protein